MILTHDLQTLFWHQVIIDSNICVTICLYIKSLSILSSASLFPSHDYILVFFIIPVHVFKQIYHGSQVGCSKIYKKDYYKINAYPDLVVVTWEEYPWLLLMKTTGRSHSKWWAVYLARYNINSTLKNVNNSFNHPPYYSMSRGDGRVVTDKQWAW